MILCLNCSMASDSQPENSRTKPRHCHSWPNSHPRPRSSSFLGDVSTHFLCRTLKRRLHAAGQLGHFTVLSTSTSADGHSRNSMQEFTIKPPHVLRHHQSSGAESKSLWPFWAVLPNEPYGFRGRKAILNHAHALVTVCP